MEEDFTVHKGLCNVLLTGILYRMGMYPSRKERFTLKETIFLMDTNGKGGITSNMEKNAGFVFVVIEYRR